jgi:hypothetical protein
VSKDEPRVRKIRHSPVADPAKVKATQEAVKRVKAKNDRFERLEELHRKIPPYLMPPETLEYIRLLEDKVRTLQRYIEPPYIVAKERKQ